MYFSPVPTALMALAVFLRNHRDALLNAAAVLGGPHAVRRTANLLDALSRDDLKLTRSLRQDLVALHCLLTLQNVHDFDSVEAVHFADIDPASPIVTEICLLTDQLTDCLQALVNEDLLPAADLALAA